MNQKQFRAVLDRADNLIAPGGLMGSKVRPWRFGIKFAIQRFQLGASLVVYTDKDDKPIRYTLHHIGEPFRVSKLVGERLLSLPGVTLQWSAHNLGMINFRGGLMKLYQYQGIKMPAIHQHQYGEADGWEEGLYCVVCATTITREEAIVCEALNIAGCCAAHVDTVVEEIMKDVPMWPNHWWGHWWLTATRGWYSSTNAETRQRWVDKNGGEGRQGS